MRDSSAVAIAQSAGGEAAFAPAALETASPLVSVIIPVYNAERANGRFLVQALESVAAQTYGTFEIIVVDDGSTDGSPRTVERFIAAHPDLDVRLVRKSNGGQSSARNLGARHARGKWLAFLDQDDIWTPTRLQVVRPHLADDVGLVYTDADIIDENDITQYAGIHAGHGMGGHHPKRSLEDVLYEDILVMPGIMTLRKSLFALIGGFDERLSGCEDDDLYLRAMQAGRIVYVPVVTLKWRRYPASYGLSRRMLDSRLVYWQTLIRDYADGGRDRVKARRISLRFLRGFLDECARQLSDGGPLAPDYLAAAVGLLPFVGPVDRASFALVEWAWRAHSRLGLLARTWFLHGLESARPQIHDLAPPVEPGAH
jgi:glycosyltransferase involved in cell wall biosynthesis